MSEYCPDGWVILKIENLTQGISDYRVFGAWDGGYLDSDHWRVNSGCTQSVYLDESKCYEVRGSSGSTYMLYTSHYNKINSMYLRSTLEDICKMNNAVVLSGEETKQFLESIKSTS